MTRLSDGAAQLLTVAAAFGRSADLDRVAGACSSVDLPAAVGELRATGLLSGDGDGGILTLDSPLVAEVATLRLPTRARFEAHRRVAEAYGDVASTQPSVNELVAHHLSLALDSARSAHVADAELRGIELAAAEAYLRAGEFALNHGDLAAAIASSEQVARAPRRCASAALS